VNFQMIRRLITTLLLAILLLPSAPQAQSALSGSIAGVVRDTTGAVLPGVTVEAASPALIEKVRVVVSDDRGQYKILDLRPGTYAVTFTLPGFSTFRREGIELTTGFTATINADLRVGALEETITVSGQSPVVDTHNIRQTAVMTRQVLDTIPVTKTQQGFGAITLGATTSLARQDVGGSSGEQTTGITLHGIGDSLIHVDGATIMAINGTGTARYFRPNEVSAQEISISNGAATGESETGGVITNYVPRDGGNAYKVTFTGAYTNHNFQASNLDDALRARGLTTQPAIDKIYDAGLGVGGPIVRDKLWFYVANRNWGTNEILATNPYNLTPHTVFFTPDLTRSVITNNATWDLTGRVAWQATPKQKVSFINMYQIGCACPLFLAGTTTTVDAGSFLHYNQGFWQGGWNYTASNRLLFEGRVGRYYLRNPIPLGPGVLPTDISIVDLGTGVRYGSSISSSVTGYSLLPDGTTDPFTTSNLTTRGSVSYVTGSHAFKVGFATLTGNERNTSNINQGLSYTFRNRVPVSLTQWATPNTWQSNVRLNLGIYAQDQWTVKRLTLNLGVRFDRLDAYVPVQVRPAGWWTPAVAVAELDHLPTWHDFTPRFGAAFDVFGNGKTVVKGAVNKYVTMELVSIATAVNPAANIAISTDRTWNDSFYPVGDPRRGNYVPDCDLTNPNANGECGAFSNGTFGTVVVNTKLDPAISTGSGVRPYNWQANAAIQQELRPGLALAAAYYRAWFGNFRVTDNLSVGPGDYDPYCVTAPVDARLPGGGGNQVCGLYDIKPTAFGLVNNLLTSANNFVTQTQVYNGVEVAVTGRFHQGGLLGGGVGTGRTVTNNCFVVDSPDERFCQSDPPWSAQTQIKFNGAYPLPWWGLQVAGTYQNITGPPITASYTATNAQIAPTLGRNLGQCRGAATCSGVVTITNLIDPYTLFGPRITQVDLRMTKSFQVGHARITGKFDVYNILNNNVVLAVNTTYGASWQNPLNVLSPRLFKFGAQVDF
jgi:Carboxypeptidase regulatory-like domain